MYKLRKKYHNVTIIHPLMGTVTFYKEADQDLLKIWHKHFPKAVEFTAQLEVKPNVVEEKQVNDDNTKAEFE